MAITQTITALPTPTPARLSQTEDVFVLAMDNLLAALPTMVTQENTWSGQANSTATSVNTDATTATTQAGIATTQATNASNSAAAAASSATTAANAPGTSATSTTSLTIAIGAQSLTIQTGKSIVVGMPIIIARTADPAGTKMQATITAYNSGTGALAATVPTGGTTGSGTYADWTISLVGATGTTALPIYSKIGLTLTTNFEHRLDTSDSAFTAILPAAPALGDTIQMSDPLGTWSANNVTVDRNGKNIVNFAGVASAENLILNKNKAEVILIYDGTNWRVI
jgi:hypothetical protein